MIEPCPCGSTEFDEYRVALNVNIIKNTQWSADVKALAGEVKQKNVWTRCCKNCDRVSFWSKPATK